jgi:hypothetical protein
VPDKTIASAFAVHLGQRAEEQVDGDVLAARALQFVHQQQAVDHRHLPVRRDHIHVARFDLHARGDLDDRLAGDALQDRRRRAGMRGRQVQDHDKGHLGGRRHVFEQAQQRGQAAGGGADADHRNRDGTRDDALFRWRCARRVGRIVHLRYSQ